MPDTEATGTAYRGSTLATAQLPRRVQRALEQVFALVSDELARELDRLLADFEQELFRLGERARNPALQGGYMDTLRTVRLHRADLVPSFLVGLESALAGIRSGPGQPAASSDGHTGFADLRLVDEQESSEDATLRMIAVRHEARASLPLLLLGQRFGVLAGAPAFEAERLPVGPHRLTRILADAVASLHINLEARLLFYRSFERVLTSAYPPLLDAVNRLLERENVLPGLSYVPLRLRPTAQGGEEQGQKTAGSGKAPAARRADKQPREAPPVTGGIAAYTGWFGEEAATEAPPRTTTQPQAPRDDDFQHLQQLLAGRHDLLGKLRKPTSGARPALPTDDVVAALRKLQAAPAAPQAPRSVPDIRQALLAQGRQQRGEAIALSREDSDTFELLGMLYTEIGRELRQGTTSSALLDRLQVPLLRVALSDHDFFAQRQHPARQLLNAVAEAGATWTPPDEVDPQLNEQLQSAVEHVVDNYDGDAAVFESANQQLQQHLQAMARKAELSERRHIEASRGKEKLELAKRRAAQVIDQALEGHTLPRFVRTLLCQAWADVLTLVLLRQGESSPEWRLHQQATHQIVAISSEGAPVPEGLGERIERALNLVGYHAGEAEAMARRLTSRIDEDDDDPASRTELAMKLKARSRLGEQAPVKTAPLPPRDAREQECFERLRSLPFGTWLELVTNQQGDVVRRRLSWYSPATGTALLVNQRGQRVDEQSLDQLARLMARDQVRVVTADRGRLVDRAWQAALGALRSFGGRAASAEENP